MATAGQGENPPPRGYPKTIFGKGGCDEKFLCNLCGLVLREPVQAYCGHRFCKSCIEDNVRSRDQIKCTQCEKEDQNAESEEFSFISKDQIFPDNAIRREMSKLKVVCANAVHGCPWKGIFRHFEEHVKVCEHKQIICSKCGVSVNEKLLPEHFATGCFLPCSYCGSSVLLKDMQAHIDRDCTKTTVACDICGKDIERLLLREHQQTQCQAEEIICPVGCGTIARKDFQQHFHERKHEVWMVKEVIAWKDCHNHLQSQVMWIIQELMIKNGLSDGIYEHLRQIIQNAAVIADTFTAMDLQLQSLNERTGISGEIASAFHRDLEMYRREVETLLQENQNNLRSLERSIALKDVNIAELELKVQSMEAASFDGTFMWRVSDFSKKHQDALHGKTISLYSPPFFTSRNGYKMCARLYPNGDGMGKGSHLSLFFVVMKGNYDALLKWPFSQKVTFCMINQSGGEHVIDSFRPDPQSSSFKRPTSVMNIASGCPLFIRLDILQNPNNGFLKDDTLFMKVAVDVSDISDP